LSARSRSPRRAAATSKRPSLRVPAWGWPALAVAVAAVVRLIAWRFQPFITVDGSEYVRYAEAMRAGRTIVTILAPGFPALIAAFRLLSHDRVVSGALVSFVFGTLLPWPVWQLARVRLGDARAVVPALLIALHPDLSRYSVIVMSESAYLFALFGALALSESSAWAAGLLMGAAYAIRPEALLPAGVLAARGLWRLAHGRGRKRHALLAAATFLVIALPCVTWYHAVTGRWTVSPKLVNVGAAATDWRKVEPTLEDSPLSAPVRSTAQRIAAFAHNLKIGAERYAGWLPDLWPVPLLLLSLGGLTCGVGLEMIVFVQIAALAVFNAQVPRYLLPLIPALAVLAALPLRRLRGRLALAVGALALTGVVMLWVHEAPQFFQPYDGHIEAPRDAGVWLGEHSAPGEPVLDRKPFVAFYAERPYVVIPDAPYDSLIAWAVRTKSRWLVVDQGEAAVFRQQLEPLLYDDAFRERETRLELAYVGGRIKGYGVGLFRILQPGEKRSGRPPAIEARWLERP
jgi:hypothetical protein